MKTGMTSGRSQASQLAISAALLWSGSVGVSACVMFDDYSGDKLVASSSSGGPSHASSSSSGALEGSSSTGEGEGSVDSGNPMIFDVVLSDTTGNEGGIGSCCEVQLGPGCEDIEVQLCVCELDDFCCEGHWDSLCVDLAVDLECIQCEEDPPGKQASCCEESTVPGCLEVELEACVCELDPFCCNVEWDFVCVDHVEDFECGSCEQGTGTGGSGSGGTGTDGMSSSGGASGSTDTGAEMTTGGTR